MKKKTLKMLISHLKRSKIFVLTFFYGFPIFIMIFPLTLCSYPEREQVAKFLRIYFKTNSQSV